MTEDEMGGWHHQINGHEFEQIPGDSGGKMCSIGEGNGKPLQYSCLENPMNSMKR